MSVTTLPEITWVLAVATNKKRPSKVQFTNVFDDFHSCWSLVSITHRMNWSIRSPHCIRDLTILGRQRDGQNKLLQINGSKDSSWYIIKRMNLIQF
jgi:hypothetical protein